MLNSAVDAVSPALTRFRALAPLADGEEHKLRTQFALARTVGASRDVIGRRTNEAMLVLDGWCALTRTFRNGSRQILDVVLPGELIDADTGVADGVIALTAVAICPAPVAAHGDAGLHRVFEVSRLLARDQLMRQVARLGRLSAMHRLADWLLELDQRLSLAGLATDRSLAMPLTQEAIADVLGLTSVHVNRMLRAMRDEQLINRGQGRVTLTDPPRLVKMTGFAPRTFAMGNEQRKTLESSAA